MSGQLQIKDTGLPDRQANPRQAPEKQKPKPPGLASAWVSGVIVFILSAGILVVVFSALGRFPWPTGHTSPAGKDRFEWVITDVLIVFLAWIAARCAYKAALRAEVKLREDVQRRGGQRTDAPPERSDGM